MILHLCVNALMRSQTQIRIHICSRRHVYDTLLLLTLAMSYHIRLTNNSTNSNQGCGRELSTRKGNPSALFKKTATPTPAEIHFMKTKSANVAETNTNIYVTTKQNTICSFRWYSAMKKLTSARCIKFCMYIFFLRRPSIPLFSIDVYVTR